MTRPSLGRLSLPSAAGRERGEVIFSFYDDENDEFFDVAKATLKYFRPAVMQVTGLCFSYPQADVFSNLSLHISAGVTLVQGGDGRGKTTLLRLLAGDLKPRSGQILPSFWPGALANGLTSLSPVDMPHLQVFWMDPRSTEHDSINARSYFDNQAKRWPGFDHPGLAALIEGLSLVGFLDKLLSMLSTGSKRKVWLAAAFASNANVALLDDPFAALDNPSIRFVTGVLRSMALQTQRAVVISGYDAPDYVLLAGLIDLGA